MLNDKIIRVEIEDYLLYDRLYTLAAEYAISVDYLTNAAIRRFINDAVFFRELRKGITTPAPHQGEQT
jgi:hypothetical protein